MTEPRARLLTNIILGLLVLVLGAWLGAKNFVPGGVFVASRSIEELSPWIKNFWPPTYVHLLEKASDGRWQQRIVVSPVTIRVRTPRAFRAVEVSLEADSIPEGSTIGVEKAKHRGQYVQKPFVVSGTTLSLSDVDQQDRDLQFQFTFPGSLRSSPVIVRALRFVFSTKTP